MIRLSRSITVAAVIAPSRPDRPTTPPEGDAIMSTHEDDFEKWEREFERVPVPARPLPRAPQPQPRRTS